ncbi:uncharacterized protein LOC134538755 [Bacillus rossius redtenbacheri]|uniref:uncharacterized protein LOC134538755 n=1 Tax=Bacillus rossius redtenbacheri TaxID=93214 RepID=UPI002FDD23AB
MATRRHTELPLHHQPRVKMIRVLILVIASASASGPAGHLDIQVSPILDSPGLYYDYQGEGQLYNIEWRLVTFVNIRQIDVNFENVKRYVFMVNNLCKREEYTHKNKTLCNLSMSRIRTTIESLTKARTIIAEMTESKARRKRSIFPFNIIGQLSRVLFGTLDEEDAEFYSQKISKLEEEQLDFLKLGKEQMLVVKSTIHSVNQTMRNMYSNQKSLQQGLEKLAAETNNNTRRVSSAINKQALKIKVNEHINALTLELESLRFQYEVLIDAVVNAGNGILNPHIITPQQIAKYFKSFKTDHAQGLELPAPEGVNLDSVILKVVNLEVFSRNNILCYIIKLPLVEHFVFKIYKAVPLPIQSKNSKDLYIFINPSKDYIMLENAKQYYIKLNENELDKCRELTPKFRICKQRFPLINLYTPKECEIRLMFPISAIPEDCTTHVVKIINTVWIQLKDNEWLYVAPKEEKITIACENTEPYDAVLKGTGKLKFFEKCKGYGTNVIIVSQARISHNVTSKDIIPTLPLDMDCCESIETMSLDEIKINTPFKTITHQLDDLKIASHKVKEVEEHLKNEEWKIKQNTRLSNVTWSSYTTFIVFLIVIIIIVCCKCGCCKHIKGCIIKSSNNSDCCKTLCFKPVIVNTYSASNIAQPRDRRISTTSAHSEPAHELTMLDAASTNKTYR